MTNVIPLDARRNPPTRDVQTCQQCGCPWFRLVIDEGPGAVAFDRHGVVLGYAGVPTCRECGTERDGATH